MTARPPQTFDDVQAAAVARRAAAGVVREVDRVIDLPTRTLTDEDLDGLVDVWTRRLARPGSVARLRRGQAFALEEVSRAPAPVGAAVSLPVGEGKTLVAMLANEAARFGEGGRAKRPIAIVPSSLLRQWHRMVADAKVDWDFTPPDVLSYEKLSTPGSTVILDKLSPDMLIFDEAHTLSRLSSARTMRVLRYFRAHPATRAIVMSGTLGGETIGGFGHLLELALRNGAPVPLEGRILTQWAAVLDPTGEPAPEDWEAIWSIVRAFGVPDPGPLRMDYGRIPLRERQHIARTAFARRLCATPGYVSVPGTAVGASLQMRAVRATLPASISTALEVLSRDWVLPDGTELVDILEFDRAAAAISVGYYHRIEWAAVGGRGDPEVEEWVDARRSWSAAVRNALTYHAAAGRDSPALIERACIERRANGSLLAIWDRWALVRERPLPPSVPTWLEGGREYVVGVVSEWARARLRGIVWYRSPVVGAALAAAGVGAQHGAGSDAPKSPRRGGCGFPVASVRVHGTGWDGAQYDWAENFVIEPPTKSLTWEQLLGRTHRTGQTAGVVRADVLAATWHQRRALEGAIARAACVEASRNEPQKLCLAQWEDANDEGFGAPPEVAPAATGEISSGIFSGW